MISVGVIGLGLIGGSIARRLAELPDRYAVTGLDPDFAISSAASDAGISTISSLAGLAEATDVIVVATPPRAAAQTISDVLRADPDVLVTDVASVKQPVLQALGEISGDGLERYLPAHPLAGAETAGWEASRADLLDSAVWAVCPPDREGSPDLLCRCSDLLDAFDARIVVCSPEEHDLAVARTSHAPHVAAEMIALSLEHERTRLAAVLSGGGFRDMTRIARADPALWSEILQLNAPAVTKVIGEWQTALEQMKLAIERSDTDAVQNLWGHGRAMAELAERMRWRQPEWTRETFDWPSWEKLLELGAEGRAIRRVAVDEGGISADVSA